MVSSAKSKLWLFGLPFDAHRSSIHAGTWAGLEIVRRLLTTCIDAIFRAAEYRRNGVEGFSNQLSDLDDHHQ